MQLRYFYILSLFLISVSLSPACSDDSNGVDTPEPDAGDLPDVEDEDVSDVSGDVSDVSGDDVGDEEPAEYPLSTCDDLNPGVCAFPWPSNLYLEPDEERATGYQFSFAEETLPANNAGNHVNPALFDHLDGYDLGVPIMVQFPNLDDSGLPGEYEIADSMNDDTPILLYQVDGESLERIPFWAELDALEDDEEEKTLFIRPAVILEPGTRYVVALRELETTDGEVIDASDDFAALKQGDTSGDAVLAYRQERFDEIFDLLENDGVETESLTLAWDFVTASSEALHDPMLNIRDDAYDFAEQEGLNWRVSEVFEYVDDDEQDPFYEPLMAFNAVLTIDVPKYVEPYDAVSDAWKLHRDEGGQIQRAEETREVEALVRVPRVAFEQDEIGLIVYGHGLLGGRTEINAPHWAQLAQERGYALVAVDLVGMSHQDQDSAMEAVQDVNHFIALADRLHQGLAEYLLLAAEAPEAVPELDFDLELFEGEFSIDADDVHYVGASQGGIFGGTFMALTQHVERGYLAVPGNNYSTLLHRSTNFDEFNAFMGLSYPDSRDLNLNLAAMNLLWSTTEPVSFLRHIRSEPFDGQPNDVFLGVAKGDWQVATITNENVARSGIDIPLLENYDKERDPFGVEYADYDHQGSGTVLFDFGNPWPDRANQPPQDDVGDPHSWLSSVDSALEQIDTFLRDGVIIDICGEAPCQFDAPD